MGAPRHIIYKLQTADRAKRQSNEKAMLIRLTTDFSAANTDARRCGGENHHRTDEN